jgi:hypothetical protein
MEERYRQHSTIVTTNLVYDEWPNFLGSRPTVEALLSQLRHYCHTLRGAGARFTLEVFAFVIRAMELTTILNHCHHHRGFVYQHARFGPDQKTIKVAVRPRQGAAAICSGCQKPAPGYDQVPQRRFEFIPFWGLLFLAVQPAARELPPLRRGG